MFRHAFEQGVEKQDRNVRVLSVPSKLRQAFLERIMFQHMLMMDEIVMRCDQLGGHPIRIVFAFCDGPTGRHRLAGAFGCLVGDRRHEAGVQPT